MARDDVDMDTEGSLHGKKGRGWNDPYAQTRGRMGQTARGSFGKTPAESVEGWVLIVTGVHNEAQEDDIYDAFADVGDVQSLHLNLDRQSGYVKGYALVGFEERKEAEEAIATVDEILGQKVKVDWAFVEGKRERRR